MKEKLYQILNIVTLIAYYLPLVVVLCKKLWKDLPVMMFSCYWALGGFVNFLGSSSLLDSSSFNICRLIFNILDVPFVLFIFYLNTGVDSLRSLIRILIPVYLFIEIMNGIILGFNDDSFKYMVGFGVLLVITIVTTEIIHYFKRLDHSPREKAISFLFLAVLFEYSIYTIYYAYEYFLPGEVQTDMDIIYYASTLIGIIIASIGFFSDALIKKKPKPAAPRQHEVLINIID
ncbi:MAG: hypothetical protein EOP48_07600 [Sphingobacteriales bacterium]|nr:MAG: hypothetical protein EOP48_07600 [Sphingobacteriales bacterium]